MSEKSPEPSVKPPNKASVKPPNKASVKPPSKASRETSSPDVSSKAASQSALESASLGGGGYDLEPGEILDMVEQGAREHLEWLHKFHRCVLCGAPPPRDVISDQARYLCAFGAWAEVHRHSHLVAQPAFQALLNIHDAMHDDASFLARKVASGHSVSANEYDMLSAKVLTFYEHSRRIERAFQSARSDLDPLTGLYNRQIMMTEISRERDRALRSKMPGCIALADIDHFKSVNDSFGHGAGDQVLQACATRILEGLRPYDTVFRYGGEEFLICLPDADLDRAYGVLERLRLNIADVPVIIEDADKSDSKSGSQSNLQKTPQEIPQEIPQGIPLTTSFGVSLFDENASLKETIERADQALYKAKKAGRNRVCLWEKEGSGDA